MTRHRRRVTQHDHGLVLPMVLVFTAIAGVVLAAVATLAVTSLRTTTALQDARDGEYAAASAIDLHIEYLRNDSNLAATTGGCPGLTVTINQSVVDVECDNPGTAFLGRDIDLTARVDGEVVLAAKVHINVGIDPLVNVNKWAYD